MSLALGFALVVASLFAPPIPATAADWHFETLDGHQTGPNGQIDSSVGESGEVTLYGGHPHAWYHDESNGDLRHAWYG